MSSRPLTAALPSSSLPARSGDQFAHELAALVDDIQRTRDWFNTQLDTQLASLHQLRTAMQESKQPVFSPSMATLFEAPRPVTPPPDPEPPPPAANSIRTVHQAIILPPTLTTTLDPQLEQATLHELNNALARAFSEISSRGGMLG
ncbi:hypothetical protein [Prosthecobacter sp.]|uniref:hypothetical protein n=1 Tax=Prosthecobacter sp. TaxID=1965333 RepID=UPI002ABAC094|nr:hypothetical protein [Prosthecobacter sp.]MDZ4402330.1 hypothetical protein [Prosthecobacter sp.]